MTIKKFSRKYIARSHKQALKFRGLKDHPFVLPVTSFLVMFFVTTIGLILLGGTTQNPTDAHVVKLNVDGQERTLPTRAPTVGELLKRLNIEVKSEDHVVPALNAQILEDNVQITLDTAKPVTIIDGSRKRALLSPYRNPRDIVTKAGVKLYDEDGVTYATPDQSVRDSLGPQLYVDRAKAINVVLYGNKFTARSRAKTVSDFLKERNIKINNGDSIQPATNATLKENDSIFIVHNGKKVITEEQAIPAPVETKEDPSLNSGVKVVTQAGSDGKKLVTYEVQLENGKEISRNLLQEVIATQPVKRIVSVGTKVVLYGSKADWLVAAGVSPADYSAADYIISRESGWCPYKWQGEPGACPAYHGTPSSSGLGYGLCQATPGYKMSSAGADWAVNPVTQLKWCTGYAQKYGGWQGAYRFWSLNHWW